MCNPMLAITAASSIAGVIGQQQAASNQEAMNKRQYDNSIVAMDANYNQVNLAHQQARTAALQQMNTNNKNAAVGTGKTLAAAGATGASGNSIDNVLGNIAGQSSNFNNSVTSNYDAQQQQFDNQRTNVNVSAASTINGLTTPAMPNYMLAGLQIGQAAYKYSNGFDKASLGGSAYDPVNMGRS